MKEKKMILVDKRGRGRGGLKENEKKKSEKMQGKSVFEKLEEK